MKRSYIKQIKNCLAQQQDILAAYLFGSYARGKESRYSDLDLAVLLSFELSEERFTDRRIELINFLSTQLNKNVEVLVLNCASSILKFMVFKEGICIMEKAPVLACSFKAKSIVEYLDFLPIRRRLESKLIAKIKGV